MTYQLHAGEATLRDLRGGAAAMGLGIGNVYYVIKQTEAYYPLFVEEYSVDYRDGTNSICADKGVTTTDQAVAVLNTGIQDALNKCVANRNDYVVVMPSQTDYDIGATITLSKKCVHLICPAAFGNSVGCTNAARIDQLYAGSVFKVSDSAIEIAGFYIKNYLNKPALELCTSAYAPNIHNNDFIMRLSSTTGEPIIQGNVTGDTLHDGGGWGVIEYNWFVDGVGDASTVVPIIVNITTQATAARVSHNELTIGDGMTATVGIGNYAVKGRVDYNTFGTGGGDKDSTNGGTFTHCIATTAGTGASCIGNRATVQDDALITGGTTNKTCSDNMNSAGGGVVDDGA